MLSSTGIRLSSTYVFPMVQYVDRPRWYAAAQKQDSDFNRYSSGVSRPLFVPSLVSRTGFHASLDAGRDSDHLQDFTFPRA